MKMVEASFLMKTGLTEQRANALAKRLERLDRDYEAALLRIKNKYLAEFKKLARENLPAEEKNKKKKELLNACKKELLRSEKMFLRMADDAIDKEVPGADAARLASVFQKAPKGTKHISKLALWLKGWLREGWREHRIRREFMEKQFEKGRTAETTFNELLNELQQLTWASIRRATPTRLV